MAEYPLFFEISWPVEQSEEVIARGGHPQVPSPIPRSPWGSAPCSSQELVSVMSTACWGASLGLPSSCLLASPFSATSAFLECVVHIHRFHFPCFPAYSCKFLNLTLQRLWQLVQDCTGTTAEARASRVQKDSLREGEAFFF